MRKDAVLKILSQTGIGSQVIQGIANEAGNVILCHITVDCGKLWYSVLMHCNTFNPRAVAATDTGNDNEK